MPALPRTSRNSDPPAAAARPRDPRPRALGRAAASRARGLVGAATTLLLAACAATSPPGSPTASAETAGDPARIDLGVDERERALDAAARELDARGFRITLRDAASGRLETEAVRIGSLLDPWADAGPGEGAFGRRLGATANHQRRRVRIEITPAGGNTAPAAPDLLGLAPREPMPPRYELRARAIVEQATVASRPLDTWSRRTGEPARVGLPGRTDEWAPARSWTTVGRDRALERAVVAGVRARLVERADADRDES